MNLKIDTRERFDIITLTSGNFDSGLAAQLTKQTQACRAAGRSVIVCFTEVQEADPVALSSIGDIHEEMYADNFSFVLCGVQDGLKQSMQSLEQAEVLNITPTLAEAIDIVSMEEVERELLGGE